MNTSKSMVKLMTAAMAVWAVAAQAQDEGTRSRTEVVAELNAARAAGELGAYEGEDSGSFRLSATGGRASATTRAAVRSEMLAARAAGGLYSMHGEDSGAALLAQQRGTGQLTRAQVIAEMLAARAAGEIQAFTGEDSGAAFLARRQSVEGATILARK